MIYEYQTIKAPVEGILLKEKGSKFLGYAYPVKDEDELKECLEKIKEEHPKATHHCYAYRLGLKGEMHRANDDGEPSGSAGLPIYNQLISKDLTNVLLLVVRYYGGVKLGVGNLVRVYKETAKSTLEEAEFVVKELESKIKINFPFSLQNIVFAILNKYDAKILDFQAQTQCEISAVIKTSQKENFLEALSEIYQVVYSVVE